MAIYSRVNLTLYEVLKLEEQIYELTTKNYELENNLANLENLNKIKVQTSIANGHFGINTLKTDNCSLKTKKATN